MAIDPKTLLPGFLTEADRISQIANAGWIFAHRYSWGGPQALHSRFPDEWQRLYSENQYHTADPIIWWISAPQLSGTATKRWSKIPKLGDPRKVMAHASIFGLKYGMSSTRTTKYIGERSFISACRSDREFTDDEMDIINTYFSYWFDYIENTKPTITDAEAEVLRLLSDGVGQAEIAQALQISESAVKKRINSALARLSATNRHHAIKVATAHKLL